MTPKSLLRHKMAVSSLDDLSQGEFKNVIDDVDCQDPALVKRMVLTSGKVYYDLLEQRRLGQLDHVAIVRIEQLYPFPEDHLRTVLQQYPNLELTVWCQEEPQNQGAWYCSQHHMRKVIHQVKPVLDLIVASRPASAAPACGYMSVHLEEQQLLVAQALGLES